MIEHERPDWQQQGACVGVDPDLFYPRRGDSSREAKAVCADCPVRQACLDYAVVNGEKFGIWGGLSERERKRLRRATTVVDHRRVVTTLCGTAGGYRRHRRRGEDACGACKDAYQRYQHARRHPQLTILEEVVS